MKQWSRRLVVVLLVLLPVAAFGAGVFTKFRLSRHHPFKGAYMWSENASPAVATPYTPDARWNYNYTGATNTFVKNSTGSYTVTFPVLSNRPGAGVDMGGHVQVTAYGSSSVVCNTTSWDTFSPPDATVNIRCFTTTTGAATDSRFDVLLIF